MAADILQTAIAVGGFAAGTGVGLVWAHVSLKWKRQEFDKAMERAEFLLKHDAASSAKEIESALGQLSVAAEAAAAANDRAKAAEARVASLSSAFRTLRSDPTLRRIGKLEKPSKKLAPKVAAPPRDADQRRAPRYRAVPPLAVIEPVHELEPVIAEDHRR